MNSFFVIYHKLDVVNAEYTLRYKIGAIAYMIFFFSQSLILIVTFVWGWVIYARLAHFLKPSGPRLDTNGDEILSEADDQYMDVSQTPFEQKREIIRSKFQPQYLSFNLQFIYLMVTLTIRTGIYVGLRLVSVKKMFDWVFISPAVFYLTYSTNIMILFGVIYFIYNSTPLKDQYRSEKEMAADNSVSIFPQPEGADGAPAPPVEEESEESVDGDALIQNRSFRSSSESN